MEFKLSSTENQKLLLIDSFTIDGQGKQVLNNTNVYYIYRAYPNGHPIKIHLYSITPGGVECILNRDKSSYYIKMKKPKFCKLLGDHYYKNLEYISGVNSEGVLETKLLPGISKHRITYKSIQDNLRGTKFKYVDSDFSIRTPHDLRNGVPLNVCGILVVKQPLVEQLPNKVNEYYALGNYYDVQNFIS